MGFRTWIRALVLWGLVVVAVGPPAWAQRYGWTRPCDVDAREPVVCEVELFAADRAGRWRSLDPRLELRIEVDSALELALEARDQRGRSFPAERLAIGIDAERECDRLLEVRVEQPDRIEIATGRGAGACGLVVWVAGNLNLDTRLAVEVVAPPRAAYTRDEAERIVEEVFLATIGRLPETQVVASSVALVERGELGSFVRSIVHQREFISKSGSKTAFEVLDELFRGLLGRTPGAADRRAFDTLLERRDFAAIVEVILTSEEYERRLESQTGRPVLRPRPRDDGRPGGTPPR